MEFCFLKLFKAFEIEKVCYWCSGIQNLFSFSIIIRSARTNWESLTEDRKKMIFALLIDCGTENVDSAQV